MLEFKARADVRLPQIAEFRILSWPQLKQALARPLGLACPVQLHLMRHGETVTNARSLVTGSQDVSLTPTGEEQARRIGRQLDPY
jgi:hypothetical protein